MPRLLVVHHTVSPATHELLQSVLAGAATDELEGVEVQARPALTCSVAETLEADGLLLGTPATIGYMAGALKHWFDAVYYPCLDATAGRPFGLWVHGNDDVAGAVRSVLTITGALRWQPVADPVRVVGRPDAGAREALWELGATAAAVVAGALCRAGVDAGVTAGAAAPPRGRHPARARPRRAARQSRRRSRG